MGEGAAIQVHHHELAPVRLDPILSDPKRLARYKDNAARLARPDAARRIARCIVREHLFEAAAQADEECPWTPPASRERSRSGSFDRVTGSVSPTCWFGSE